MLLLSSSRRTVFYLALVCFSVSDHYAIGFMNNPNVLVGILPEGMVILDILDDTMINEDRTLRLTLTSNPGNPAPVNVVINETLVIIEDNDAPGKFKFWCVYVLATSYSLPGRYSSAPMRSIPVSSVMRLPCQ